MDKATKCKRLAEQLGWVEVDTLEGLQEVGVPNAVHGDTVWLTPAYYRITFGEKRWVRELDFDPWGCANDDLRILEFMKNMTPSEWSDYKDCLYHETEGHGTHNVWDYKRGKFANAAIMLADRLGRR